MNKLRTWNRFQTWPFSKDLEEALVTYQVSYFLYHNRRRWNRQEALLALAKTLSRFGLSQYSSQTLMKLTNAVVAHVDNGRNTAIDDGRNIPTTVSGKQMDMLHDRVQRLRFGDIDR